MFSMTAVGSVGPSICLNLQLPETFISGRIQNAELRQSYERDVSTARKAVSGLESRLAAEKTATEIVEQRMASLSAESKESREKLWLMESTNTALGEEVSGLDWDDVNRLGCGGLISVDAVHDLWVS